MKTFHIWATQSGSWIPKEGNMDVCRLHLLFLMIVSHGKCLYFFITLFVKIWLRWFWLYSFNFKFTFYLDILPEKLLHNRTSIPVILYYVDSGRFIIYIHVYIIF